MAVANQISTVSRGLASHFSQEHDFAMLGFLGFIGVIIGFVSTLYVINCIVRLIVNRNDDVIGAASAESEMEFVTIDKAAK